MKKQNFSYQSLVVVVVTIVMGFALGFYIPNEPKVEAQAQNTSCEIGESTIQIPVLCWAADAANFVVNNQLFSIVSTEDLRDAVKHYRFYQLVMSERNQ